MNDFSLDELKEIAIALNVFGIGDCGRILYSKIQFMIDNYCEHDYTETDSVYFIKKKRVNMIDYKKIYDDINNQILSVTQKHARVIEDRIKETLKTYGCTTSQIELEVRPAFTYKIKIKAYEFSFDYNFNVKLEGQQSEELK